MANSTDIFGGAAVTALGLAASRTAESSRPDRLIDDPLARAFFEAARVDLPMRLDWPQPGEALSDTERLHLHGSSYIGLRTRFYDDQLLDAATRGVRQGLLIGAGLDTRAYRLPLPAAFHLIELDHNPLMKWKQTVLAEQRASPRCRRSWIGVDLRENWTTELPRHEFDPKRPTIVIAEGLLPYLTPDQQSTLMQQLASLTADGSALALDHIVGDPHAGDRSSGLTRRSGFNMTCLLATGGSHSVITMLQDHGWRLQEQPVAEVAAAYGRSLADPFRESEDANQHEPPWLDTRFVHGTR